MTITPIKVRNENTITAHYTAAKLENQPKQLTGKQQHVMNVLDKSLPFFGSSGKEIKAEKGKADKPPLSGESKKMGGGLKEAFQSFGRWLSGKSPSFLSNLFKSESKKNGDNAEAKRYGDTLGVAPEMKSLKPLQAGGVLAFAFETGGVPKFKEMVGKYSSMLNESMIKANYPGTIAEYINKNLQFTSENGYALRGTVHEDIKQHIPELRIEFANNPVALGVLDAIQNFDFDADVASNFNNEVNSLLNVESNPLGKFMRNNNATSTGLVVVAKSEGFDQNKVANQILVPHMNEMEKLNKEFKKLGNDQNTKQTLKEKMATKLMNLTRTLFDEMMKTEGKGSLVEMFGQAHLDRAKNMALQIAGRNDIDKDTRNQAIQTVYRDTLFLRGTIPALINTTRSGTIEKLAVTLMQSIANGVDGSKFSPALEKAYNLAATQFREDFANAMIKLGMPVVK